MKVRKSPPRKGPNAVHGGTKDRPMHYMGHVTVKQKVKRKSPPIPSASIAELWGNKAPDGDMAAMRRKRSAKIEKRAEQSRRDKSRKAVV